MAVSKRFSGLASLAASRAAEMKLPVEVRVT